MVKNLFNILMLFLDGFYKAIDFPLRLRNLTIRNIRHISVFSQDEIRSDSQAAFYERAISKCLSKESKLRRFRRAYDYREIDYGDGKKYLELINKTRKHSVDEINQFKINDIFGSPRKFHYQNLGCISPTTLRYIHVATDIHSRFEMSQIKRIVEIGAGYGGQISILDSMDVKKINKYFVFDLPNVQTLIKQYLSHIRQIEVNYLNIEVFRKREFDLVISNYAFSELPLELQKKYLEKVLLSSKNGYLLMNSGAHNTTGRSEGKLTIDYLKSRISQIEVYPENPLTGPDNYLIIWRE
jgi:putative sugar O-methyltransferase